MPHLSVVRPPSRSPVDHMKWFGQAAHTLPVTVVPRCGGSIDTTGEEEEHRGQTAPQVLLKAAPTVVRGGSSNRFDVTMPQVCARGLASPSPRDSVELSCSIGGEEDIGVDSAWLPQEVERTPEMWFMAPEPVD